MTSISSTNPSRANSLIGSIEITPIDHLEQIISEARNAQKNWKNHSVRERSQILKLVYTACVNEREKLEKSIAQEMGMPIRQARDEVTLGLTYFLWYIDNAENIFDPEVTRETDTELHVVYYEPRGLIAAVAPWNYPFSMMIWTCIQALLAGNSVIFKTSKECILTGKLIADIFEKANFPKGVWTEIYGTGELGEVLVRSEVDGITFTGSTRVGKNLAKIAIDAGIGCVMELGGSAPGIVCADADVDNVIDTIYFLRFSNAGQMCDGLKRLIVHTSRYDEVIEKLSKILLSKKIGDALDEATDIGPLASDNQVKHIHEQYIDSLDLGAEVVANLAIPGGLQGAYFAPKILSNITRDMKVWHEETFGPILPVIPFDTLEEAIELANDTPYGLGAYVFTQNNQTFDIIAKEIKSGMVQMNNLNYCIPENPFGGYKHSGIGREHGKWGFHEFCNIKVMSRNK